jgi:hypothetical protein
MELPQVVCNGVVFRPGQIVAWKRLTHEIESISNCVQNGTTATLTNVATKKSEAEVRLEELKLIEDVKARAAPRGRAKEHRNLTGAPFFFENGKASKGEDQHVCNVSVVFTDLISFSVEPLHGTLGCLIAWN